jgi:hypothetical protein
VAFKPLQSATSGANGGSRIATLALNDDAPASPQGIPLSGMASDFSIASSPGQAVVEPIIAGQSATYLLGIASQIPWITMLPLAFLAIWALGRLRPPLARLAEAGVLLVAFRIAIAACGGGSADPADPPPGTPANTYIIRVTATVSPAGQASVTRTFPLSLTVP